MDTFIRTSDYLREERFERWRELVSSTVSTPIEFVCDEPRDYRGILRGSPFGDVLVSNVACSPCRVTRSEKMIRRADLEVVHVMVVERGAARFDQAGVATEGSTGDVILYGSWRPYVIADDGHGHNVTHATIPFGRMPIRRNDLELLFGTPLSGRQGVSGLLAQFLTGLAADVDAFEGTTPVRLGEVLTDLVTTLVAEAVDAAPVVPADSAERALMAQIHDFIRRHLHDPKLTPAVVAAAHHISVRALQRLFQQRGRTVTGWIRHQRLERCRRDLVKSELAARSVHAIAARWGFVDPAHFSRTFRAAYGVPPGEYRAHAVATASVAGGQPAGGRGQ
ncbi:helix-turn-helix domain-containing protein [Saccharothrix stipae]